MIFKAKKQIKTAARAGSSARLLYPRRQTADILGGVSMRVIKDLEEAGLLTVVRLNKKSPTAQVFHPAHEVLALAQAKEPNDAA
jgi:hypothetical protein